MAENIFLIGFMGAGKSTIAKVLKEKLNVPLCEMDEMIAVSFMKENGRIVLLSATPETIYERVRYSKDRPILNGHMNVEYIRELMEKRRSRYESVADLTVATDGRSAETIADEIIAKLREA